MKIAFFGTPDIAVTVLEELKACGISPELIVTNPDKPQGRKMILTPPPVKTWATDHDIPVFQPDTLRDGVATTELSQTDWDVFVVVAYGQIIPTEILDLPKHGVINVHPSLLPKLRGASPIRSAILADMREEIGVSIMLLDEKMDHGPILAQLPLPITAENWPLAGGELDTALARMGGALLADTLPKWIAGEIETTEQDHEAATFCAKIQKADGELTINPLALPKGAEAYAAYLKIAAYDGWPGTFFYTKKGDADIRVSIAEAILNDCGDLQINRVVPAGKNEMTFESFVQSLQH